MADREAELGCDLLQRELSAEVGLESFAGPLHLPGGETAAIGFADALQPAVSLDDVCCEREHHVIDEKLVGLVHPAQRLQKQRTEMTDNGIVVADAEPTVELADARRAGLIGDAVERRTRQIEKQGMERLVDHVTRIALE